MLARIRILLANPTLDNLADALQLLTLVVANKQARILASRRTYVRARTILRRGASHPTPHPTRRSPPYV